jgi:hypothetical protein
MMADLIPLQCPSCAGHVDPVTLQCKSCGLQFKMKSDGTLMKVDIYNHKFIPIGASICIPSFYVADHTQEAMEMTLHRVAEKLAEQILPLVEWQAVFNMEHNDYVMYGRIRVAEPEFNNKKFDEVKRWEDIL